MGRAAAVALALVLLSPAGVILAYNIDIHHAVVRRGPHGESFFGYSVAQYSDPTESWMIVGAPLDNETSKTLTDKKVGRPGTVYRCNITQGSDCVPIIVDKDYIYVEILDDDLNLVRRERDKIDNQWLGSSISAFEHSSSPVKEGKPEGMIIVCAHRYVDRSSSTKQWFPIGQCSIIDKDFNVLPQRLTPCKDKTKNGVKGVSYCQTGVSATISEDGYAVVLGAPGAYRWQGIVQFSQTLHRDELFVESTRQHEGADAFAYMGYSSDFAKFKWKPDLSIYYVVVGAPRQDGYFGRVVVFEYDFRDERIDAIRSIPGSEFGAYFGHSVAAVDLNGDGFDDLLVGAPMYSETHYERGAVHVYVNDGEAHLEESRVFLLGTIAGGRFGHAVAKAKDLNGDSFDDAVISAPYTPNGGVIYIYHGSVGGIKEEPSQVITAEDFNIPGLKGFGVSLSAGMDLDKNQYPDILVGAYSSDRAILLRSRPVVNAVGTITAEPQFVNYPDETKFSVKVCLKYNGRNLPKQLMFDYNVTVDESRTMAGLNSRATFDGHRLSAVKRNLTLSLVTGTCKTFTLELRKNNTIIDKVSPIVATLTYQLSEEGPVIPSDGNPNISQSLFPVLRSQAVHSNSTQAYLLRDCGSDSICIPDLQIVSAFVNTSGGQRDAFVLGSISDIVVAVSVKNVEENAYNARLIATFPRELTLLSPLSCDNEREDKSQVICSLGNPLGKRSLELEIRMSVSELTTATRSFIVELEAVSDNLEENATLGDNSWTSPVIRTTGEANFGLSVGKAVPDRVGFDPYNPSVDVNAPLKEESQIGVQVTHSFTVLNNGPSTVGQSELFISWPLLLDPSNDTSYLLYIIDVNAPESVACDTKGYKDPLGLLAVNTGSDDENTNNAQAVTSRKKRSIRTFSSSSSRRTRRASEEVCPNGTCIHCRLQSFAKDASADIIVVSRLYERTLVKYNIVELNISSLATLKIPAIENLEILGGHPKLFRLTTRITEPTEVTDESVAAWVIVVAVIGTTLLLIGAIAIMGCLGFFKRSKKEQLEREKEELATHGEENVNANNAEY